MITLETKLKKVKIMLADEKTIANLMPTYMDLRGFASISDLQAAIKK